MPVSGFHQAHKDAWNRDLADESRHQVHAAWFRTDTADYWRHARMYEGARAFLHRPEMAWLTVGDGRFGLDSIRLRNMGFSSALPTDIGDGLLGKAKADGLITEYGVENAESLSFEDNSFDLVLCKESYHHCPRAPLALYEMLRVARHAVVLVEPRDYVVDHGPTRSVGPLGLLSGLATWCRVKLHLRVRDVSTPNRYVTGDTPHYEESGNYMYAISSRELEKAALGLDLPAVAFKGLNDCYLEGGETEPANETSALFESMRAAVVAADHRTSSGRGSSSMLMAIIFKELPDPTTRQFLITNEWLYKELARNPHASTESDGDLQREI